jgi:hypothetical protein
MTRQTELDRRWYDTGYEDMGIGFAPPKPRQHVPISILRLLAQWALESLHIVKKAN